jgi:hypothetical protein
MRYYATAFLRETEENRELMQAYMGITANILALLDRDALDDRSMMSGREEIIQQYIEQARSDPYEPGNCSFCGERPVAAWFEGPTFKTFVRSSAEVRSIRARELQLLRRKASCGLVRRPDLQDFRSKLSRGPSRGVAGVRDVPRARGDGRSRGPCCTRHEATPKVGRRGSRGDRARVARQALLETSGSDVKECRPAGTPTRCGGR